MTYTEIQTKKRMKYYYRTLSIRKANKFSKFRVYLGTNLNKKQLKQKENEADLIIQTQSGKTKKLTKKQALERIYRTKWEVYHNRASMIPILTGGSLFDVFSTGFTPLFGYSYNQLLMIYKNGFTYAIFPKIGGDKLFNLSFFRLQKEPTILKKFIQIFQNKSTIFLKNLKKIEKKFTQNISNKDIVRYYNKYYKEYENVCLFGEPFPWALQTKLPQCLESSLKIKDKKRKLEIFTLLVSPILPSFINREEEDLYKIAKKIKKIKKWLELFQLNEYSILDKLQKFQELNFLIKQHKNKYYWVTYDYIGKIQDEKYFIKRLKEILSTKNFHKKDFEKERKLLIEKQEELFNDLISKGIITKKDKLLFLAAQDATYLMDLKKEMLTQAHYIINKLLNIAAKRLGITLNTMVFAHKNDLPKLLNNKMNINILKQREKKSAYYFSDEGLAIFTGKDVDNILNFAEGRIKNKIKEFSGICANPGTIIGKACVLQSPKDIKKLKKGDILITGMTTPEYVPAMKKASAIITNEGGITCHAAIVSRELGIPCIVGTKIATQVLRNDDLIELHAGNGVIKLLRRGQY